MSPLIATPPPTPTFTSGAVAGLPPELQLDAQHCAGIARPRALSEILVEIYEANNPPPQQPSAELPVCLHIEGIVDLVAGYADNRDYSTPVYDDLEDTCRALLDEEKIALERIPVLHQRAVEKGAGFLSALEALVPEDLRTSPALARQIHFFGDHLAKLSAVDRVSLQADARTQEDRAEKESALSGVLEVARRARDLHRVFSRLTDEAWLSPSQRSIALATLEGLKRSLGQIYRRFEASQVLLAFPRGPQSTPFTPDRYLRSSAEDIKTAMHDHCGLRLRDRWLDTASSALRSSCVEGDFRQMSGCHELDDAGFDGNVLCTVTRHPDALCAISAEFAPQGGLRKIIFAPFDDDKDVPAHMAGVPRASTVGEIETLFPSDGQSHLHDYSNLQGVASSAAEPFKIVIHAEHDANGLVLLPAQGHFKVQCASCQEIPGVIVRQPRSDGRPPLEYTLGSKLPVDQDVIVG